MSLEKNEVCKKDVAKKVISIQDSMNLLIKCTDTAKIVDISGEIIEELREIVDIININFEFWEDKSFKSSTILLKDYFINYINGIFKNNKYIMDKYEVLLKDVYKDWCEKIHYLIT